MEANRQSEATFQDVVTGQLITAGPDVNADFEQIIAEQVHWNALDQFPPEERVGMLLGAPVGIQLMSELRMINPLLLDEEQRLIYAHLWERCVGWVCDQASIASAEFIEAVTDPPEDRLYSRNGRPITQEVCLDEVGAVTGLSTSKAAMRIVTGQAFAADGPLAATGVALRTGRISWEVASAFVESTMGLSDAHATAVQELVLPRAVAVINPETGEGCWRSRAWAIKALRRAVIAVDPDTVIKRREEAAQRRYVDLTFDHACGMAYLTAYLPAHLAMELHDTLNALAGAQRREDETTNPDERPRAWGVARVDALVAAIRAAGHALEATGSVPAVHGRTRIELGVIVDLPTLLRLADHPGEILGYGPIDPDYARLLAADAHTWRRWVLEPVTGHLIDLGRTKYRPSQELRDYILAAFPECSRPECDRHSAAGEIDHVTEWHDDGPTSAANLHALCRRDHIKKTNGLTSVRLNGDGTVTHTSRHGLQRTKEPYWKSSVDDLTRGRHDDSDPPPF